MDGTYVGVDRLGGMVLNGQRTEFQGGLGPAVMATCIDCGNAIPCERGETVLFSDERVCQHVKTVGPYRGLSFKRRTP